jgi:hypothetical protein
MRLRTSRPPSFETLIEDLFEKTDWLDEAPRPSHPFSINSLEAAWEIAAIRRRPSGSPGADRDAPRPSLYPDEPAEDAADLVLDPARILIQLGLHAGATDAEVMRLRREFALRNHPDRVPAELRDIATQRMMIANDLIDRHVARLRRSAAK